MSFACATPVCAPSTPLRLRNGNVKSLISNNVSALGEHFVPALAKGHKLGPLPSWPFRVLNCYSSSYLGKALLAEIPEAFDRRTSKRRAVGLARCEQASKDGNSPSVWLGRLAMLGFVGVIGTEITTGKGVLEQVGISSPAPTVALALTAVVGIIAAVGIFRSAAKQ